MKLRDELLRELIQLVGRTNSQIALADGSRTLKCRVEQCDALGAAISDFGLETSELAATTVDQLAAASSSLCRRVTYLLEPISPVEIDAEGCVVQMRSSPPRKDDQGVRYYELAMRRGGAVTLSRYEKQPGDRRAPIPALLTHEVLGRLTEDFWTAVDEALAN